MNQLPAQHHLRKLRVSLTALLLVVAVLPALADDEYEPHRLAPGTNLAQLGGQARALGIPVLIMFSTPSCEYCERLESEVLGPMTIAKAVSTQVVMGKVEVDSSAALRNFNGQEINSEQFADDYSVAIFPTVVLLDARGKMLLPKIIGYQTPEFYAAYLDAAIKAGRELIRSQGSRL